MNTEIQSMLKQWKKEKEASKQVASAGIWQARIQNLIKYNAYRKKVLAKLGFFPRNAQITVTTFWGHEMKVLARNPDVMLFDGKIDSYEMKLAFYFIKNLKPDDVFYDVGSHYGFYSILASKFIDAAKGEIHAFEPQPQVFDVLSKNIGGLGRHACANNMAVSNKEGESEFYIDMRSSGASTLLPSVAKLRRNEAPLEKTTVKTTTLDKYVEDGHRPPSIMKVDVEGAELSVIMGAERTLADKRPIVTLELWEHYSLSAAEKMIEYGYTPHFISHNGATLKADLDDIKSAIDAGLTDNLVFKPKG